MFDLTGKIALVTGAASGIGEAIAFTYSSQGAVVFVADIDRKNGDRVVSAIEAEGGQSAFLSLDVANDSDCLKAVEIVYAEQARLHILVNNAGLGHVGTILEATAADLDRLYAV